MAKLLENDAKTILKNHEIPVPAGVKVDSLVSAKTASADLKPPWVIKALLPMGKKGKAGLVLEAEDTAALNRAVDTLLGEKVEHFIVEQLWMEEKVDIAKELYVSIVYDNLIRSPVLLLSDRGGIDIEELTASHPDSLFQIRINIQEGLHLFQARQVCFEIGLDKDETAAVAPMLVSLYDVFYCEDLRLLEINPLAILADGSACAVGTLLNMDDEALFRHPEFEGVVLYGQDRSLGVMTELEQKVMIVARKHQGSGAVRFTELDGDIAFGIIGGGASIVAMDAIIRCGGRPANYTDMGAGKGGAERMKAIMMSALSKPGIRGFITGANIAGGGDIGPMGILTAQVLKKMNVDARTFPVVARWAGFGEEQAHADLRQIPGIHCYGSEVSIEQAAEKLMELVQANDNVASRKA